MCRGWKVKETMWRKNTQSIQFHNGSIRFLLFCRYLSTKLSSRNRNIGSFFATYNKYVRVNSIWLLIKFQYFVNSIYIYVNCFDKILKQTGTDDNNTSIVLSTLGQSRRVLIDFYRSYTRPPLYICIYMYIHGHCTDLLDLSNRRITLRDENAIRVTTTRYVNASH